jgi:type VI secretion system protein ImpF
MNDAFNLTSSILDRLVDMEPENRSEPAQYRVVSERRILNQVFRDIENLLNTRCSPIDIPVSFKRLKGSLIRYGLTDSTAKNPESSRVRKELCKEIEKTIALFEPRLKNPIVRIETRVGKKRELSFRISGVLVVEPLAEPVSFDTFFDINQSRYVISK